MNALKKSALLIALTAAATAAHAGPTQIYGTADVGYSYAKAGDSAVHNISSNGQSDSFIGFKASEDLGNGVKAVVTLEAGYNIDGASGAQKRETSIGLTDGIHTLKAGRLESLGYAAVKQFDAFGGGNLGMARGISNVAEYNDNSVGYTFSKSGLTASYQHSFGEIVDGGLGDGSTKAASVAYTHGPMSASLVRTEVDMGATTTQVAGSYDMGVAKTSVIYQDVSDSDLDNTFMVGVSAPVKGFIAKASIGQAKLVSGDKVDLYSIGGSYNLSKRTSLYAAYGRVDVASAKGEQLGLGINHSF